MNLGRLVQFLNMHVQPSLKFKPINLLVDCLTGSIINLIIIGLSGTQQGSSDCGKFALVGAQLFIAHRPGSFAFSVSILPHVQLMASSLHEYVAGQQNYTALQNQAGTWGGFFDIQVMPLRTDKHCIAASSKWTSHSHACPI